MKDEEIRLLRLDVAELFDRLRDAKGEPGERGEVGPRGEPGERGRAGLNGRDGIHGLNGADGATWFFSSKLDHALGLDGDFLLLATGQIYQKQSGAWRLVVDIPKVIVSSDKIAEMMASLLINRGYWGSSFQLESIDGGAP